MGTLGPALAGASFLRWEPGVSLGPPGLYWDAGLQGSRNEGSGKLVLGSEEA